jgi:hypothetical protein
MAAPRLDRTCKHGRQFVLCDDCANTIVMSVWAQDLDAGEIADALMAIAASSFFYAPAEKLAILAEAARRFRLSPSDQEN